MTKLHDVDFVQSSEDLLKLKPGQKFMFRCGGCGELYFCSQFKRKINYFTDGRLLCGRCRFMINYDFKHAKEKREKTKELIYGDPNYTNRNQAKCTISERYGVDNVFELENIKNKSKETKLKKYGDEKYCNRDKARKTMLKRYGVEYSGQSKDLLDKACKTKQMLYGNPNYSNREQAKETCMKKYGTEYYNNSAKAEETNVEKYGKPHIYTFGSEEYENNMKAKYGDNYQEFVMESLKESNLKAFGYEYPLESKEKQDKSRKTMLERYGVEYSMQCVSIRNKAKKKYEYLDGLKFDSGWELALWIYAKDHGEEIIREPCKFEYQFDGKTHYYSPDFKYNGRLIEIKGLQYYLNHDPSKRMVFPYNRSHSNSEELTLEQKHYLDDLYEAKHQCGLSNGVEFWSKNECEKYIKYVEDTYGAKYLPSFKVK